MIAVPSVLLTLALGSPIPAEAAAVKMTGVDGKEVTIAGSAGPKGTLVVFTCNACPFAKAWEGRIVELGNRARKEGFGVLAVNPNDPRVVPEDSFEVMAERAAKREMTFPYVVDATSGVARAFGATRTPEVFLFDAQGALVYHGAVDDNHQSADKATKRWLADALQAVAAGTAVPVAETKAMGCTIKFRSQS